MGKKNATEDSLFLLLWQSFDNHFTE